MGMQPPAITGQPATAPLAEHKAWSVPGVLALVAGCPVMAGGCMPMAGHLLLTCLTTSTYHIDINLSRRPAGVSDGKRGSAVLPA